MDKTKHMDKTYGQNNENNKNTWIVCISRLL